MYRILVSNKLKLLFTTVLITGFNLTLKSAAIITYGKLICKTQQNLDKSNHMERTLTSQLENLSNENFTRILSESIFENDEEIEAVKLLTQILAHFNDSLKTEALILGLKDNPEKITKILTKFAAIIHNENKDALLRDAVDKGNRFMTKFLLLSEANVDCTYPNGDTVLMKAVRDGYENIANLLLKSGANIDFVYSKRYTALEFAIRMDTIVGNNNIIQLLTNEPKRRESVIKKFSEKIAKKITESTIIPAAVSKLVSEYHMPLTYNELPLEERMNG